MLQKWSELSNTIKTNLKMKINLTAHDIKTLEEKPDGWTYTIKTKTGRVIGSGITTK